MAEPLFCPRCGGEYLASVVVCAECEVALVPEHRLESARADALPPASELSCVRAASVGWARALSERLAAAGISHRIEAAADAEEDDEGRRRPGSTLPYGVYVLEDDLAAALEIDRDFMSSQIPDLPEAAAAADEESCPACGEPAAASARECPSCGLALLFEE